VAESGSSGLLGVSGSSSVSLGATTGDVGAELSIGLIQSMLGGGFTEAVTHQGIEVSLLVPWQAGDLVPDNGEISGPVVEILTQ
jgi:hypothetical protein